MIIDTTVERGAMDGRPSTSWSPRHPWLLAAATLHLLLVIALWVVLRWQGERWWLATLLLLSPRWPFTLPIPVLLGWIAWRRAWGHTIVVAAAALVLAFPILGIRVNLPRRSPETPTLRLLSFNVHRNQVDPGELLHLIASEKPDIVALQDWTEANDAVFDLQSVGDGQWYRQRTGELFLASRYPIRAVMPLEFPDTPNTSKAERGAATGFAIDAPQGRMWVVNVHLASPHGALETVMNDGGAGLVANSDRRWGQSEQTLGFVETRDAPVVIAGDFNTTDDSPLFQEHWSEYPDAFSELGWGLGYTYVVTRTQIRIDHVLATPGIRLASFRLSPRIGSPHRPLLVDLELLGDGTSVATGIGGASADGSEAGCADGR